MGKKRAVDFQPIKYTACERGHHTLFLIWDISHRQSDWTLGRDGKTMSQNDSTFGQADLLFSRGVACGQWNVVRRGRILVVIVDFVDSCSYPDNVILYWWTASPNLMKNPAILKNQLYCLQCCVSIYVRGNSWPIYSSITLLIVVFIRWVA